MFIINCSSTNDKENKLIFLEKAFYFIFQNTFLDEKNIENNIQQLNDIIIWIIMHKQNKFNGIASDKYLSCIYVELIFVKNLYKQKNAV